jgi:glycosyltransferase involved in cell wall biosynthesis
MAIKVVTEDWLRKGSGVSQSATKNLRVLAVIPGPSVGRSFVFARRQIASLIDAGVDVHAFFLASRTSPRVLLREWRRLRREIRDIRPQLLHAHFGTMTSFFCAVSSRVPLVITFRGSDLNDNPDVNFFRLHLGHLLSQISCLKAEQIICVSSQLRDRLWWRKGRAVVIPNGVNLNLFRPQRKDEARALLGWEQTGPIVGFCGRGSPRNKGLQFVQAAVRVAEQVIGPIQLVVFDGNIPPELMPCYLNGTDCFALASLSEGSPNIVKEALACNVPVVATDVGDVAVRLKGVHPSRIVRRDIFEFGNALADILLERRPSNGRDQVGLCDEVHVAQAIRSVYKSALKPED